MNLQNECSVYRVHSESQQTDPQHGAPTLPTWTKGAPRPSIKASPRREPSAGRRIRRLQPVRVDGFSPVPRYFLTSPRRLFNERLPVSPHDSRPYSSRNRGQRETASGVRGGGVGRARKKEKKGREVVSCRTLDEAHARCEAARAFTRGKQEAGGVCTRTRSGPGPRRAARGPTGLVTAASSRTRSKSGYGPCVVDHAAHVSGTRTNRRRARPSADDRPRSSLGVSCLAADWPKPRGSGHRRRGFGPHRHVSSAPSELGNRHAFHRILSRPVTGPSSTLDPWIRYQ